MKISEVTPELLKDSLDECSNELSPFHIFETVKVPVADIRYYGKNYQLQLIITHEQEEFIESKKEQS